LYWYISTKYNNRPINEVQYEINRYITWYNNHGIFFDEEGSDYNYYVNLTNYAKSKGIKNTIGNLRTYVQPDNYHIHLIQLNVNL